MIEGEQLLHVLMPLVKMESQTRTSVGLEQKALPSTSGKLSGIG